MHAVLDYVLLFSYYPYYFQYFVNAISQQMSPCISRTTGYFEIMKLIFKLGVTIARKMLPICPAQTS